MTAFPDTFSVPSVSANEELETKTFLEHLEDLRWMCLKSLAVVFITTCVAFYSLPWIMLALEWPLRGVVQEPSKFLLSIGPGEVFIFSIKLAIYSGICLALPLVLYFVGEFVLSALTRRERGYLWPAFIAGGILFLTGAAFCFFYVLPKALQVSIAWARWMHLDVTFWRVGEYVSFVTGFMLGMGLAFETPVVLLVLVKLGVIDYRTLQKGRRYWVVFSLVAGALLTTPEVFTQVVMAIVLCVLYEVSIWGAWLMARRAKKAARQRPLSPES